MKRISALAAAVLAAAVLAGCPSIGPPHVVRDRFDYAKAISRSWKENMLLNLVKLRYADAPLFLDVSSVVEQYTLQGTLSAAAEFPNPSANPSSVGGTLQWADRPTLTFQPLTGRAFTKSLLTPLRPEAIMELIQSGWPVDFMFRLVVGSINGIDAGTPNRLEAEVEDPRFGPLLGALGGLQQRNAIGVRKEEKGKEEVTFVLLPRRRGDQVEKDRQFVVETLGLNPALDEYRLTFGALNRSKDEIALLTRTVLEILGELAFAIEVPPEHELDGRVGPPLPPGVEKMAGFRVSSGKDRPGSVFAAVPYEDYWYWIDERDFSSKRTLTFMLLLIALAERGGPVAAPALTLPTGP
jgi:hypothetical protein